MNPLVPTGWDVAFGVLALVAVTLTVVALISLMRSTIQARTKLLWVLFVLLVPIIGAVAWVIAAPRPPRDARGSQRAGATSR